MQSVFCEISYKKVQTVYLKHFSVVCKEPSRGFLFHLPVKLFVLLQNGTKTTLGFYSIGKVKKDIILIIQAIVCVTCFFSSLK